MLSFLVDLIIKCFEEQTKKKLAMEKSFFFSTKEEILIKLKSVVYLTITIEN